MLQCPCGLQYMGNTKRTMQIRLGEYITNIRNGFKYPSVSKHYATHHNRDPANTLFIGIDKFSAHWRGSAYIRGLSRLEITWIYRVRCYTPFGLNIDVDMNTFIDNS